MSAAPLLEVNGFCCRYTQSETNALTNVSFTVGPGEFLCITGKSGCGKSTLARCVAGILPTVFHAQTNGQIRLDGKPLSDIPSWHVGKLIGMVFQNPDTQFLTHNAEEEVALGLHLAGLSAGEIPPRVDWALRATGAESCRTRPIRELSAGQKMRALIAAALARRPKLLVLDESFALLDPQGVAETLEVLGEAMRQYPLSVVVLEHRIEPMMPWLTRAIILEEGRLVYDGPPGNLLREDTARRYGLRHPVLRSALPSEARHPPAAAPSTLEAAGLHFAYPQEPPLFQDCSLHLERGGALALHGANGTGKSTLLRLVAGLLRPQRGQIQLNGILANAAQPAKYVRQIGYLPQIPHYLFHEKTVKEELKYSQRLRLHGEDRVEMEEILESCDVYHLLPQHPLSLSGGEVRRLAIAAAIARNPILLLLDEPSVGMDGERLRRFLGLLHRFQSAGGAVLIASNDSELLATPFTQRLYLQKAELSNAATYH